MTAPAELAQFISDLHRQWDQVAARPALTGCGVIRTTCGRSGKDLTLMSAKVRQALSR